MKEKKYRFLYRYYRKLRTSNETRKSFEEESLIRPKRRFGNLKNSWDDYPVDKYKTSNCWKAKRKSQETNGNKKFVIAINTEIFSAYDIVHEIQEHIKKLGFYYKTKWMHKNVEITYYGKHIGNWNGARYKEL